MKQYRDGTGPYDRNPHTGNASSSRDGRGRDRNTRPMPSPRPSQKTGSTTRPSYYATGNSRRTAERPRTEHRNSSYGTRSSSYANDRASRSRTNMIYAPPKRRRWPFVALIAILIVIICIAFLACRGLSGTTSSGQTSQTQQTTTTTPTAQSTPTTSTSTTSTSSGTTSSSSFAIVRSEGERKATSTSRNNVKPDEKVVYLTFDDGPSGETSKILSILDSYGIKATWFVVGNNANLSKVKDIWADGNQVALHTYTHDYESIYASTSAFWSDIDKVGTDVEKYLGFTPTLLRFPGGSHNGYDTAIYKSLEKQCYQNGMHYFDWNVSSGDAAGNGVPAAKLLKNIKKESKGTHSCCVLMHDTEAKATTVEALPSIIEYYKDRGYKFDVLTADSFGYQF